MKIKRCMAFVLSAVLTVAGLPVSATAAPTDANGEIGRNQEIVYVEPAQETEDLLGNLPDNDELFQMYVDGLFFGNPSVSVYGDFGAQKLEGLNLEAYRHLKEKIHQIAMGEAASSQITITLEELGITKREWTAEELGVASIVTDKAITQEAVNALSKLISPDLRTVLNYLLVDCPWDLYWYDKTAPTGSSSGMSVKATNTDGTWLLYLPEDFTGFTYDFPVAAEYRASSENLYSVNTDLVQSAKTAAENAKQIVRENAGLNDFQKLTAYKDKICELVSYNHQAVDTNAAYGNPWQLIWVFDGNPDTGVVCEGYSKAFQYLCDLSDFNNSSVACYTVTGIMNGGTGAGGHMWNIATMGNGKNYIVDVTNCDTDTIGAPDHLFLAGASGSVSGGYAVSIPGGNVTIRYEYDNGHPEMYGDVLNISDTDYVYDPSHEDNCPNHHLDSVAERPASCTEDGNIAYYICQACQKVYSSADGTGEIRLEDTVVPALGHNYGTEWDSSADTHYHVCSRCQDRADEAEHVFEWVTDTEPTETTAGTRHEECSVCGRQGRQETIDPLPHEHTYSEVYESDETGHWKICEVCQEATEAEAHVYGDWTVKKEGSCTESGQEARTCGACGYEETRETGTRHDLEAIQPKEPTCTEAGNRAYFSCKNCGQVFEDAQGHNAANREDFEVAATGHDYGTEWGSDETGHYHICKTCNEKTEAEEHTFRWIVDIEPTETTEGTRHEECSVCGYRGREETIEKPLPHDHEYGESYESDETGHWKICEVCQKATETEAHEYGDWTVKKEGSCTEPGQEARTCGTCGYEETREIGARHEIEAIQAKEPTCTEAGNRAYFSCKNCGQVFEDAQGHNAANREDFEVAATGHDYGTEWGSDETGHYHICKTCNEKTGAEEHTFRWIVDIEPTETTEGTRHEECSVCGYRGREETIEKPLPHDHEYGESYESDETGHWKICEVCQKATETEAHEYGDWTVKKEGSCTEPGQEARACGTCGYEETRETGARHEIEAIQAKEPTCTEAGNQAYFRCKNCGQVFEDEEGKNAAEQEAFEIPATGHDYGTEWGSDETGHYHICKTCNEKTGAEEHTFRWIVDIEPTETTEGTRHEECSVCGYRGREETIEKPLPHDHEYGESYESDETGHWKICEVCQKATETEAHEYGDWTVKKEGTCTEPGQEARACGICGYEETRETRMQHDLEEIQPKEPTCTEAGNRAYFRCKNCGQVFEDEEGKNAAEQEAFEIPATGHKYGEWIIDSPQTCTQPGTRHRVCSMCDYVDTGYIAADGHDWEEYYGIDVPATCTTSGSQSRSCKSCGETDVKVIPAAGHSMKKTEAKEATCTETGNVEYYTCLACRKIFLDAQGEQEATETGIINTPKISHLYEIITTSATTERDGSSYRKCTVCGSVAETQAIFCPQTVTLSYVTCTYNGKAKKPSVTVYDRKGNVISPESYTVSYSKNKNVGTAVVRVVFQGNYSGIVTRTFAIRTKGTTILKLKSVSKGFTVTWKKNKNQTTGYQIQYAANKNFKGAKVKTYEGVTKATVVKLKAKKKYYVRIRTYKKVDGVRIYSDWSKAKSVKTKR